MSRPLRIDYPGAWHHVMHRGARQAPVFKSDDHCHLFMELLTDVADDFELEIHAYSLTPNHYHLLIRSRHGNLSQGMKHLNATYTQRVNAREHWDGPIFRGRFRSQIIKDESQLPYLLAYLHLNPLKAGLVTRLYSHCWTSHRAYMGREPSPSWLTTTYFEDVFEDSEALHHYVLSLHREKLRWPEQMSMDGGWMTVAGDRAARNLQSNVEARSMDAQTSFDKICAITGADMDQIKKAEKGPRANPARRFATWALRKGTQLTQAEIGDLLGMSANQVAHVLRRLKTKDEPMAGWIDQW